MKQREKCHLEYRELSFYTITENFKLGLAETNSVMTPIQLPPLAWNCHTHCFDPDKYPFKATRAYTPEPARVDALIKNSFADQLMLVQATIEDGYSGLIGNLNECRNSNPSKLVLGTIFWDPESVQELQGLTAADFDKLHEAGVRSVRIHGSYGGSGDDLDWVEKQFLDVARHYPVHRHNWSISAQLPLTTWSSLEATLLEEPLLEGVSIIADHNGCANPSDVDSAELQSFLRLLETGRFFVKIGALHRRSPTNINLMRPLIETFANRAAESIMWGSDWPHIDGSIRGLNPTPPLLVDTHLELAALKGWLTTEQWMNMLVHNPTRVFGTVEN